MFRVKEFNYVVFDEAHMLKNMNTQRYEALIQFNVRPPDVFTFLIRIRLSRLPIHSLSRYLQSTMALQGNFKILLTGTPLQNNLLELMSLLSFLMPDLFRNREKYIKLLFSKCSVSISRVQCLFAST